jgi:hypothetical protein
MGVNFLCLVLHQQEIVERDGNDYSTYNLEYPSASAVHDLCVDGPLKLRFFFDSTLQRV